MKIALLLLLCSLSELEAVPDEGRRTRRYTGRFFNYKKGLAEESRNNNGYLKKPPGPDLTEKPTLSPVAAPSVLPTFPPVTASPTPPPSPTTPSPTTGTPTRSPMADPTTPLPTGSPMDVPMTPSPTRIPTVSPTRSPVVEPTTPPPTPQPTDAPTRSPVVGPTTPPPTPQPTNVPTRSPVVEPTTPPPTPQPTDAPTRSPVVEPTTPPPTPQPTNVPTRSPVVEPTTPPPTPQPTDEPTMSPITPSPTTPSPTTPEPTVPPLTPPPTPGGCSIISAPALGSSNTTIMGRTGIEFSPSECNTSPFYPGPSTTNFQRFYEEIGPFQNPLNEQACVTVQVDPGTCVLNDNVLVFVTAFTSFDPQVINATQGDPTIGYLGSVANANEFDEFSFSVQANEEFVIVGQQVRDVNATDNGNECIFGVNVTIGETCLDTA